MTASDAPEDTRPAKGNCKNCGRLQLADQLSPEGNCVYCHAFGNPPNPPPTTPARRRGK